MATKTATPPMMEQLQIQTPQITQAELLAYVGLKNKLVKLEAELETQSDNLKQLLTTQVPVEDGPLTAILKYEERRNPKWKNEFIDLGDKLKGAGQGEKLAAKVLEKTEPTPIIKLEVK